MTQENQNIWSENAEAFAGLALASIAADRQILASELTYLQIVFSRMRLFEGWSAEQHTELFDRLHGILEQEGLNALLEKSIQSLAPKFYQTAFAIAVDLVLADGVVNEDEKDFLYDLQQRLQIHETLAMQIIEVIVIKNRC